MINNVINNITTGITDEVEEVLEVYPNPTEGPLNINPAPNLDSDKLDIIDSSGKEIDAEEIDHDSLNVSSLPKGLYLLRVSNDRHQIYKRFVKQ